jgi:hypothetical protein
MRVCTEESMLSADDCIMYPVLSIEFPVWLQFQQLDAVLDSESPTNLSISPNFHHKNTAEESSKHSFELLVGRAFRVTLKGVLSSPNVFGSESDRHVEFSMHHMCVVRFTMLPCLSSHLHPEISTFSTE